MKKIRLWFRIWKAMRCWIRMSKFLIKEIDKMPLDSGTRAEGLKQLNIAQTMIGSNVLRLVGAFPLEDGWDFDET